jgi:hypothetical protein
MVAIIGSPPRSPIGISTSAGQVASTIRLLIVYAHYIYNRVEAKTGSAMKKLLVLFALLLVFTGIAAADPAIGPSLWRNQRGSILQVKSISAGFMPSTFIFSGTFINQGKNFACKGIPYAAFGTSTPQGITFHVFFAKCSKYTQWTGRISPNGRTMTTNWQLFYILNDPQTGSDVFTRLR